MPRDTCPRDGGGSILRFGDLVRCGSRLLLVVDLHPHAAHVVVCAWVDPAGRTHEAELLAGGVWLVRPALYPRPQPEP